MAHTHPVVDADSRYSIDIITRNVSSPTSEKKILIQHDHNSERLTFECDRYVESHDLSLCNKIEVHYANQSGSSRQISNGLYEVSDLEVDDADENKVVCSWLISNKGTKYSGTLEFVIKFACIDDELNETYSWHTNIYKGIIIAPGIENSEVITSQLPDIITMWKEDIYNTNYAYETAVKYGFSGTEEEWLLSLDGLSAYEIAVKHGYEGTEEEWLSSLIGLSAYEIAVKNGFVGTEEEWLESYRGASVDHTHNDLTSVGERYTISIEPDTADKTAGVIRIKDNASGDTRALMGANEDTSLGEISQISLRNSTNTGRVNIQSNDFGKKGLRIIDENGFTRVDISHNVNGDTCVFQINDASGNDITLDTIGAQKKRLTFEDITIATSAWEEDSYHQYEDYPYQTAIPASGVDSTMYAEVVFGVTEATSGNYAPICAPQSDVVWIYAKAIPDSDITIKSVVAWR